MKSKKSRREFMKCSLLAMAGLAGCDIQSFNKPKPFHEKQASQELNYQEITQQPIPQPQRQQTPYSHFRFQNELETIEFHAQRVGVDTALMLAIREAENGREGLQFGIIPTPRYNQDNGYTYNGQLHHYPNDGELSKQASWAAWTIRRNRERFNRNNQGHRDFISFLAEKYAPIGAGNDPNSLNRNWETNVRNRYNIHSR